MRLGCARCKFNDFTFPSYKLILHELPIPYNAELNFLKAEAAAMFRAFSYSTHLYAHTYS